MRRAAAKPDGPNRVQKRKPGLVAFKRLIVHETDLGKGQCRYPTSVPTLTKINHIRDTEKFESQTRLEVATVVAEPAPK